MMQPRVGYTYPKKRAFVHSADGMSAVDFDLMLP